MKAISSSIAPVFSAALVALLTFGSQPAFAAFAVIIDNPDFSISSTSIPVGGSVQITSNSGPFDFSLSGDYVATYYPGDYAASLSLLDQFTLGSYASFSAPGSVEGTGGFSFYFYNLDGIISNSNYGSTFTYNTRGVYTIDYSYDYYLFAWPLGTIYENPNINDIQ